MFGLDGGRIQKFNAANLSLFWGLQQKRFFAKYQTFPRGIHKLRLFYANFLPSPSNCGPESHRRPSQPGGPSEDSHY